MLSVESFFDLHNFPHLQLFPADEYVWSGLNNLKQYMDTYRYPYLEKIITTDAPIPETIILHEQAIYRSSEVSISYGDTTKGKLLVSKNEKELKGATVVMAGAVIMGRQVDLGPGVLVESGAMIKSPAIIGAMTEIRQGAYLRGYTLTGKSCVLGHTTEVKHSIFLDEAKAGHFAYIGDSILGKNTNLGAGTKFANLRFLAGNITIRTEKGTINTGRRKLGAILGDHAQTGCNSVTNPGTLIGKKGILMPNTTAPSGYHPPKTIIR